MSDAFAAARPVDVGALGAAMSGMRADFAEMGLESLARADADAAAPAMRAAFAGAGFDSQAYVSPVAGPRAEVLVATDAATDAATAMQHPARR